MSKRTLALLSLTVALRISALAADLPGSKDPPGMKRYAEGSEIIGYREPVILTKFLVPTGSPTSQDPAEVYKEREGRGLGQQVHVRRSRRQNTNGTSA